jgi:hypothetical protein
MTRNPSIATTSVWRSLLLATLGLGILAFDPASSVGGQKCGRRFFRGLRGGRTTEAFYPVIVSESAKPKEAAAGSPVARSASESAMLIRRSASERTWQLVDKQGELSDGDLVLGLAGSALDSQNSALRLEFMGNLNGLSPYPIIESAVVLHENPAVDLDFSLDRGRVQVVNRKENGPAHIRVQVRKEAWDITLQGPGAAMGFEIYGRWPRGVGFSKTPDAKHVPVADVIMIVVKGEVVLRHGGREYTMTAPPGPAMIEWDSVVGHDEAPERLEKLPDWATAGVADTPEAKAKMAAAEHLRQALLSKPLEEVLQELVTSENLMERRLAVYAMGALDDLAHLSQAARETKYPDVLENAIIAFRHWIGRKPGQDQILYNRLIEVSKYKPVHAETIMQLLHSFGDEQLARPETYQTLIDYLDHEILPIRALAHWHLVRLVPAGKKINYNPNGTKEEQEQAVEAWRKLVPPGQVPGRAKADKASQ